MNDLELRSNWQLGELERTMLDAARHERMPDALGARMAEGLGVHWTGASVSAAAATTPLFVKAGLWGVLSVGLIVAASWQLSRPSHVAQPREQVAPVRAQALAIEPPVEDAEPVASAAPRAQVQDVAPIARAAAPNDDAALIAEIALLDRARNALRERSSVRAVALLDQHARRFARGKLAPEAAALRIEALVQRGSHAEAEAMAQRFVRAYPDHPLSAQVSKLTQTNESP